MNQKRLFVGIDLRDDVSQMAVLGPMHIEPEIVAPENKKIEEQNSQENNETTKTIGIPTRVTIPGTEERIENFLEKIYRKEPIYASGKESDPVNVLAAFFRKTLALTKKKYPNEAIRQLVITTEYRDFRFISMIYLALNKIGIGKDRAMVIDRRQSYIYYVMSQKKELWVNQVGLFDYTGEKITYYQMQTDRFKRPMLVSVGERDYSDYVELFHADDNTEEEKNSIFEGMVQGAIHGQIMTTLYMTGSGFADGFAGEVMKKLCVGRHLFQGDNLYVYGACYCAREVSGEKHMDEFVYLDEDTISSHVTMEAYTDAKVQEIRLAKAGTPWYQIDYEVDLIPDGDCELDLKVKNILTKETVSHMIPMEGIPGRTDRRARIGVQIRFAGKDKCIVTIRDKGFGEFFPSSYRIWEETISL